MNLLRQIVGLAALMLVGCLLGAGLYESVVLAPNFRNDVPNSLEHFRLFMRVAHPGNFFRVLAPAAQIAVVITVVLGWKVRPARWWFVAALVTLVAADIVTFTFHYPRNHLMFHSPLTQPVADLARAAQEWGTGNVVRVVLVAMSMVGIAVGLRRSCTVQSPARVE